MKFIAIVITTFLNFHNFFCLPVIPSELSPFLASSIDKFDLLHPKIIVPDFTLGKQLQHLLVEKGSSFVIGIKYQPNLFQKILFSDYYNKYIVVGERNDIIQSIQMSFNLKFLSRSGTLFLVCLNCVNGIPFFKGFSTNTRIIIAFHYNDLAFNLVELKYSYKERRMISHVIGYWKMVSGFQMSDLSPSNHFESESLISLCMEFPMCVLGPTGYNNWKEPRGLTWDIVALAGQALNFKINWTVSNSVIYEELLPNGTWVGSIQEFINNDYDLLIGCFLSTQRRRTIVDLTHPVLLERFAFVIHYSLQSGQDTLMFTKHLFSAKYVCLAVLFISIVTGICLAFILNCDTKHKYINWFLLLLSLSLNQGRFQALSGVSLSLMIIIFVSAFFFWMLTSFYSTFLMSILTVTPDHRLTTVSEVVRSHHIMVKKGSATSQWLNVSTNSHIQSFAKKTSHVPNDLAFDIVCNKANFGYLIGVVEAGFKLKNEKACSAYVVKEVLFKDPFHLITRKGSALGHQISLILLKLRESGILSRLMKVHGLQGSVNNNAIDHEKDKSLYLSQLSDIFVYFFVGVGISLIAFLIEILCYTFQQIWYLFVNIFK